MMGQPKPFASLSSGLLARKGQAKPAMRPQGFSGFGAVSEAIDDLGWNDMGHNDSQPGPAPAEPAMLPPVLRERQILSGEMRSPAPEPVPVIMSSPAQPVVRTAPEAASTAKPVPVKTTRRASPPVDRAARAKAAFTLRLDGDRHLRLRLASALRGRSAQQLVTEALDIFLKTLPEVEAMASRLSPGADNETDNGGLI